MDGEMTRKVGRQSRRQRSDLMQRSAQEQNKKRRVEKVRLRERRTKTGIRKTGGRGQA